MTYWQWKNMNFLPRTGMEAWHQYEPGVGGHNLVFDYSGYNRHISCSAGNSAILTPEVIGGQPGWYFNGSRDPLAFAGNLLVKHLFIVASYQDATFPAGDDGYKGLVSGKTAGDILTGNAGSDTFFDYGHTTYRKADVIFAANNQKAPMFNQISVIEVINNTGISLDGIHIGQQRGLTARKWKGYFIENLMYSDVKNDNQRLNIYRYFALRYHLWRLKVDSVSIFPFSFERPTVLDEAEEAEVSEAEGGRGRDRIIRYLDDSMLGQYALQFAGRHTAELNATRAFNQAHRLHIPFWLQHKELDSERKVVRTSGISAKGVGAYSHDYQFSVKDY